MSAAQESLRAPPPQAPATVSEAARWLRRQHLPLVPATRPRIGAEYELLALDAATLKPAAWKAGRGPLARWLKAHTQRHAWRREDSDKGAPKWRLPHGGVLTLEPGGQVEYATPPCFSPAALSADLAAVIEPLQASAAAFGITLHACGIDPYNPLEAAPLQFAGERYLRMAEHFAGIGPAGARMMRQTASLQVNLDAAFEPDATWRVANALVPYLVARFANSRCYAGEATRFASFRARTWRELDPARTGLFRCHDDPAVEYARFALRAPALLVDGLPFAERSRSEHQWREHLTTLFPEVRPRGYLEIRCIDSVPLAEVGRALRMLTGLLWHPEAFGCVAEVIGLPDGALLDRAGAVGLEDETLRLRAERLVDLGESAARELSAATFATRGPLRRSRS